MSWFIEHLKEKKSRIFKYGFFIIVFAFIIFDHFKVSPQFAKGEKQTEFLRNINENDIGRIELCDSEMCKIKKNLTGLDSSQSKSLFARGMHDLDSYSPNHDSAVQEFYLIMYDVNGQKYEFDTYLKSHQDKTVYMHLLERPFEEKMHWLNLGSRKSKNLYKWLEYNNLIKPKG